MNEFNSGFFIVGGSNCVNPKILEDVMKLVTNFSDSLVALEELYGISIETKFLESDKGKNLLLNIIKRG